MNAPCLLIVEDHEAARQAMMRFFVELGWNVQTTRTATYAQWLLTTPFDCIIVDLTLPDGTGESVLEAVEASRTRTCVVVATQNEDPARLAALQARFMHARFLPKPLDLERVRALCEDARSEHFTA